MAFTPNFTTSLNHRRQLDRTHDLAHLADVYTYTTAISQCSSHHQLRRALELVAEMRARGVALNVHTYRWGRGAKDGLAACKRVFA